MLNTLIRFFMKRGLIVIILLVTVVLCGVMFAPFDWTTEIIPRDPVPVDAIPDIGENQQIVFTKWAGRSPRDIEDQITYPLTIALLGIPGVKTIRSSSMFGFSVIYVIFKENIEFYWSRSRILEKISSLPPGTLPKSVNATLGPDATALGQVFWYTLEGLDESGNPAGGWDADELRSIQDYNVRYSLMSAEGVSEVASVGGFVKEYQVDADPDLLKNYNITLNDIFKAVSDSNIDVGAGSIEINKAEYVLRGIGFIKNIENIRNTLIKVTDGKPVYVKDVSVVTEGPALRRGALDKNGVEAVGGVVVARFGENPLKVIKSIKGKISEISSGLPEKKLKDGTISKVNIVPFYDRTKLIYETLGTLNSALYQEILVTVLVILFMVVNFRSSILISSLLPVSVLMCFIAMKFFKVDANIVALSGIAIAIGTMVDMGIVITENILKHIREKREESRFDTVYKAVSEVSGAVFTALATTIVGFIPVFVLTGAEGKLFKPLAYTKTFALISSALVAFVFIPYFAYIFFKKADLENKNLLKGFKIFDRFKEYNLNMIFNYIILVVVAFILSQDWMPLGYERGRILNFIFMILIGGLFLYFFKGFNKKFKVILEWCLENQGKFLLIPFVVIFFGLNIWFGFDTFFGFLPDFITKTKVYSNLSHKLSGLGKEFMPFLDEGSFLYMPTTMPHASITTVMEVLKAQDMALKNIYEVEDAVGKLGRADTSLDPAPLSMIETVINYKEEYLKDKNGNILKFAFEPDEIDFFRDADNNKVNAIDGRPYQVRGKFVREEDGRLIKDIKGMPFRLWRPALETDINEDREYWKGIRNTNDIWDEILKATDFPGVTSAPKLQPISTRIVMLQTGMRAPMGIKVTGPDIESLEIAGRELEKYLKNAPGVRKESVAADRVIGKPYIEIVPDRKKLSDYGISIGMFNNMLSMAAGGKTATFTVEGRERYSVRVRYLREKRDNIESLEKLLISGSDGVKVPLGEVSKIIFAPGPVSIKSENGFLISYVLFDKIAEFSEVDTVNNAKNYLNQKIREKELNLPDNVSFVFSGTYENQLRAEKKFKFIIPITLIVIFLLIYFEFDSILSTLLVFSTILIAWAGGFIMIWLYAQDWFLNFHVFGQNLRDLFQMGTINLSVAVWVGFMALFGIASDDGVMMGTFLNNIYRERKPENIKAIRKATVDAALKRVRACLMTSATTILALLPVLTSSGRGADIMIPMAIPVFGGMFVVLISLLSVPVMFSLVNEVKLKLKKLD